MYYYEELAERLFEKNPELDYSGRAVAVIREAYPLMIQDLGQRRANCMLSYDEDFPSDLVSSYANMVRQSVEDGQ